MTHILVRDLMSSDVETLVEGETMDLAETIMNLGRIRHLPVVDRTGCLTGLVTHRDLLGSMLTVLKRHGEDGDGSFIKVDEVMKRDLFTVLPDSPAVHAAELMLEHKLGCVLVVEERRLVGILTEADFVKFAVERFNQESR